MDKAGAAIPPMIFIQVLHMAYPQFAEKSEHGGFAQQVTLTRGVGFALICNSLHVYLCILMYHAFFYFKNLLTLCRMPMSAGRK